MLRQSNPYAKRTLVAPLIFACIFAALSGPVGSAQAAKKTCGRFIVGRANSSAYRNFRLPARGTADGSSCVTLRRIARRLHTGRYKLPNRAFANAPKWGPVF